jgi:hypothetical protein
MTMLALLAVSIYWHLPIMVVLVSLVYTATRYDDWHQIFRNSVRNGLYIVVFMGAVFLVLLFLSTIVPLFW